MNAWIAIAVGVAVVIVLGLHVPVYLRYRPQRRVAAEVRRLGGDFLTESHAPPWPASVLADEYKPYGSLFERAYFVGFCPAATDANIAHLAGLTDLRRLVLEGTQVTDAGLVHLAGLAELTHLYLGNTQVTDAGLVHLAGLPELKILNLAGTQVTDAGVARLRRKLPGLTVVR